MLIWSLFVVIYFGLQTILLQNMYQNPQSAAQVADGTSKHYRKLFSPEKKSEVKATLHCTWLVLCRKKKMNVFSKSTLYVFPFYHSLPTWCSTARFSIQFSRVIFDTCFSQDNMKNLPNKTGPENFLYYIVSWWNNYFKLWLRKEEFFVEDKWHFVQNRFLLFVSLCSVFFFLHW